MEPGFLSHAPAFIAALSEHERGACSTGLAFRFREGHHRVNEYHIIVVLILVRRSSSSSSYHPIITKEKTTKPNNYSAALNYTYFVYIICMLISSLMCTMCS